MINPVHELTDGANHGPLHCGNIDSPASIPCSRWAGPCFVSTNPFNHIIDSMVSCMHAHDIGPFRCSRGLEQGAK